jgi:putative hemolysin
VCLFAGKRDISVQQGERTMTLNTVSIQQVRPLPRPLYPDARPVHDASHYPRHEPSVPPGVHRSGRYSARFARTIDDLRAVQRLRFEVFNLELSEGLHASYSTGLDVDEFDLRCHHLMVIENETGAAVGTYRLMTSELAQRHELYTATEFDLSGLPDSLFRHGAEVGRACVGKDHRNGRVLQLLWRGIARYLDWNDKRYVFGCCSVPTLAGAEIAGVSLKLAKGGHMHPRYLAKVAPALRAELGEKVVADESCALPPLFTSYLRLGAKVCGGPALDRQFGVTDYLVVLDLRDVEPRVLASLSAPGLWRAAA